MNSGAKNAFSYTACQRTVMSKPLYSEYLSRAFTVLARLVRLGSYCALPLRKRLFAGTHVGVGCPDDIDAVEAGVRAEPAIHPAVQNHELRCGMRPQVAAEEVATRRFGPLGCIIATSPLQRAGGVRLST